MDCAPSGSVCTGFAADRSSPNTSGGAFFNSSEDALPYGSKGSPAGCRILPPTPESFVPEPASKTISAGAPEADGAGVSGWGAGSGVLGS